MKTKNLMTWLIGFVCPMVLFVTIIYFDLTRTERMSSLDRDFHEVIMIGENIDSNYFKLETSDEYLSFWDGQEITSLEASEAQNLIATNDTICLTRLYGDNLVLSSKPLSIAQIRSYNESYYSAEPISSMLQLALMVLFFWMLFGYVAITKK